MAFKKVDTKQSFPKMEEEILKFWDENEIFEKTLKKDSPKGDYVFYDGPPFATGTPHYGHIVASTMKDAVPRFWTMKGYHVDRKWGWDCHGLPIENIAEKELGIKRKTEIEEMGVEKFNEFCRSKVLGYVDEWKKVIRRLGRWADMENSYRTMDLDYMESIWWVFKQLWDKGLIYEGYRSMHVCTRCETTLSQQEVSEGYKDIKDLSAVAKFELVDEPGTFVLAWTTTPWTLIGNVALAVGKDIIYTKSKIIKVEGKSSFIEGEVYIFGRPQTGKANRQIFGGKAGMLVFDKEKDTLIYAEIEAEDKSISKITFESVEFTGNDLTGKEYKPLFDYYQNKGLQNEENGWKIYAGDFVTTEEGTGVVHIAPAFGEDDLNLGKEKNLPFVQHVGMDGIIKAEAGEFAGMSVKPQDDHQKTDIEIIKYLAKNNLLFAKEKYEHSYPHCWRCDTPLINYATSSWFVAVTKIKEKALELAKEINWSPQHIKEGRFGKWLEGARDWSISRQRFWASVMPIWKCEECGELRVFGSIKELEEVSGEKVNDLHKHIVDKFNFPCEKCKGKMKRIPDVLDTWFDSGSMPYAQVHYPFENKEKFEKNFPARFIAEGVDQTRAWFYYLHVMASSIKDSIAFKNVIVNGTVLAEDGKKMSKRLNNYPDPSFVFDKYGADPLRFYLLSSPVVAAENLNFSEKEVSEFVRGMFRMLWNSYSFFALYANVDKWEPSENYELRTTNLLDKWIISELNVLVKEVNESMENYELNKAARLFPKFIDNLSNWYIRRSRKRFWKSENDSDKNEAYAALHHVLVELSKLMAPFTPFVAEEIYKNLTGEESVHLAEFPVADEKLIDEKLNRNMEDLREIITQGLQERAKAGRKVRQPLSKVILSRQKYAKLFDELINKPEWSAILRDELNVKGAELGDVEIMALDVEITEDLKLEGIAREFVRFIQEMRKEAGYEIENRINVSYQGHEKVFAKFGDLIAKETLADSLSQKEFENFDLEKEFTVEGEKITVRIKKA